MKRALAAAGLTVVCSAAAAAFDGNELLRWHEAARPGRDPAMILYIHGMADVEFYYAMAFRRHPPAQGDPFYRLTQPDPFCIPDGVRYVQAYDVVIKYLQDNPAKRNVEAEVLVRSALRDAWPCQR